MLPASSDGVAVLVLRAWSEGEGPASLRARITWVNDVRSDEEHTAVASGSEDILEVVRGWLGELGAGAAPSP
jgi:hypothetical protein